jgi:hypothetical protein
MIYYIDTNNNLMEDDVDYIKLSNGEYLEHRTKGNTLIRFCICWESFKSPTILNYNIETEDEYVKSFHKSFRDELLWENIVEYLEIYSEEYKSFSRRITAVSDRYSIEMKVEDE